MATTAPRRTPPPTVEEYLCLEEASPIKHEYVAGQIFALAGASRRHNAIAMNVSALLWNALGQGPCRVFDSDMRLRIGDDAVYYPDVQVVCDPSDTDEQHTASPCVVVEVLSPSTESIDLREKLLGYRRLESLRLYLIVYRDQMRVIRHYRAENNAWFDATATQPGDKIPFPCPEVELALAEIYAGLAPVGG
jgi:Uma2 family endonuclease